MLVLGLDVGGTASRALVTTLDGTRVGFGRAGAGNPVSVPLPLAVAAVRSAVAEALSGLDASSVGAAVIGLAGSAYLPPGAFDGIGVPAVPKVVGDVVVAFAAGTSAMDGTVLISGTGAVAARIVGGSQGQISDGLGWLLGDLGSGFWLGRSAATHTARALYSGRSSVLSRLVSSAVRVVDPDEFVIAVQKEHPHALARLAPLVSEAAMAGDAAALSIVDQAAEHLVSSVEDVHEGGPIVLSGSVLRESRLVRAAVERLLADRWPETEITVAEAGEVGAARLAARLTCLS